MQSSDAVGIHTHPELKLGKRSPSNKPAIQLLEHLAVVPAAPITDLPPNLSFPIDLNDQIGCCVVAGLDHSLQTIYTALAGSYTNWTAQQIVSYYRTQNPDFDLHGDPNVNGPGSNADGGMDIQTFLAYLVKQGIILGFAKVDHTSTAAMQLATWLGLAIVTGETLTVAQQTQRVWDIVDNDPIWGGHCTCTVGYATNETCVTWGKEVDMTRRFEAGTTNAGVEEAWFIVTQAHVDHPSFRASVDLASFGQAYTQLTGRPFNWQPSPGPTPPTPTPTPSPDADHQLATAAKTWVATRHVGKNHIMALALQAWLKAKSL